MGRRTWAGIIGAGALAAGALLGGAGAAQADPPPGWGPGEGAVEYDLAGVGWIHHGWYAGQRGNWHTGYVIVEEDDDGITGSLVDWRCPAGAPGPTTSDTAESRPDCRVVGSRWLEYTLEWDTGHLDHATGRMTVNEDVPAFDEDYQQVGTVRLDLTIKGHGEPEVLLDDSGAVLDYTEIYNQVNAWGKVDGHRIRGPGTTPTPGRVGYWLDGWVRTP